MRLVLVALAVAALAGAALFFWQDNSGPALRPRDTGADLTALRLQATDLQRSVETLARSENPDPAELAALAARLEALTRSLEAIEGQAGN
jgi:hypothetical protein